MKSTQKVHCDRYSSIRSNWPHSCYSHVEQSESPLRQVLLHQVKLASQLLQSCRAIRKSTVTGTPPSGQTGLTAVAVM
ncbi:hypothetical protein PoB_004502300 [Plakobranchus ocellatus]|uniref:Uncharacterized protein n=1 Tax=Plakobranchus ocellatus TaxID=259542 RepID=A0AAV4BFZ4_9GAST|nr:hypothetical protein PoB_004502300 [Plakobranchus ocellatus]